MKFFDVFTPDSIIAAAVAYGSEDPREVAYNTAAYALDRDDIHMIMSVENKRVYYIAATSADFAAHPNAVTPLAASLPGMKGHRGDGAYVTLSESGYAVVIKKGDEMYSYVGDRASVDAFIASHNVPTVNTNESMTMAWEGFNMGQFRRASKIAMVALGIGAVLAIIAAAFVFLLSGSTDKAEERIAQIKNEVQRSIQQSAQSISSLGVHPMQQTLSDLQRVSDLAASTGGLIKQYSLDRGELSWRVELPVWVTGEYIERFDKGLTVRLDQQRNVLVVEKGMKGDR